MGQVFNNPYTDSVMWSLQGGLIMLTSDGEGGSIDSTDSTNMLAATESIQISQQRQVTTRTPLVGTTSIKIGAPPQGSCTLTTLIGPHHVIDKFMSIFGDACHTFTTFVTTTSKGNQICKDETFVGQKLIMKGCAGDVTEFTLSSEGGIAIARGVFRFSFDTLEWENGFK